MAAGTVGMAAGDPKPVVAPADARNVAADVARTRAERPVQQVQMKPASNPPDEVAEDETLRKGDDIVITLEELIGGQILVFLIGLHPSAETNHVRSVLGVALVPRHPTFRIHPVIGVCRVVVIPTLGPNPVESDLRSHEHRPAELRILVRILRRRKVWIKNPPKGVGNI